jgi:hypothetical protein
MAKIDMVTAISIMVKPEARRERCISIRQSS